jgi:hypothetical protein
LKIEEKNSKKHDPESQLQDIPKPDPDNVISTALICEKKSEPAVVSDSEIVVSAEIHALKEDTLKSIEYLI